jgi:hypothetical protein
MNAIRAIHPFRHEGLCNRGTRLHYVSYLALPHAPTGIEQHANRSREASH